MSKSLINPFELLGINEQSTLKDARKSYYNLAMICHPDQGGDAENMKILANAYKFVEIQLKSVNDVSQNIGENLEKEFEKFNISVKAEILPMRDLFDLAHDEFNKKFNEKFVEEEKYQFEELVSGDPFSAGYGSLMDTDTHDEEEIPTTRHRFSKEIMIYNDPQLLPNTYGNNLRYDITNIEDFTEHQENLKMNDYRIAHRELENEPIEFKSDMDTPMKDLEKLVKLKEKERSEFEKTIKPIQINLRID